MTRREELGILIPAAIIALQGRTKVINTVANLEAIANLAIGIIELKNEQELLISGKGKTE